MSMKRRPLKYILLLPFLYMSIGAIAQDTRSDILSKSDSLMKVEKRENSEKLADLKAKKDDTQAKAREAQRIERDASKAAKWAKKAYRAELKAQKARKNADKQVIRARKSRTSSET